MTWTINLTEGTATHRTGLVVRFQPAPGEPGVFDGRAATPIPAALQRDPQTLARLLRDAGDAFIAARAARH